MIMRVDDVEMKESDEVEGEDPVVSEKKELNSGNFQFDVVVCKTAINGELYRVQYPTRKTDPYASKRLRARFKRSVKMLEMKMLADTQTSSFDRGKAEHLASILSGGRALAGSLAAPRMLDEETYVGRCFQSSSPIHYALGFFIDRVLYLCPMKGTFEMRRSIAYINERGKGNTTVDADAGEVESDSEQAPGPAPIRVRFLRPETEKQKKRREESSLHRSKLIEQDPWIPLEIHSQMESVSREKRDALLAPREQRKSIAEAPDPENLIEEAIIGEKLAQLDLEKCDQLISLRRIRHLPDVEQVHALIIKARIITTPEAVRYLSEDTTRDVFVMHVRDFAHMVCGVWVIKSEMLYQGDDHQTALRSARDLALCLITSGLPVRRSDLRRAFGLSIADLDAILSTFAKVDPNCQERGWILRVEPDITFGRSKLELDVMVSERRYWHKRWEQIHRYLSAQEAKVKATASRHRSSSRSVVFLSFLFHVK
ncbi:unnamed protein product [Toxocara canis]|uniref:DNA-directed RNA polymerase III subunit RPC3 n=1 Tax=Toxocara canis TaxID=6265 RepID=A0A183UAQ3_TOXCA|nr:unnamed protein product [Toxocara canis]